MYLDTNGNVGLADKDTTAKTDVFGFMVAGQSVADGERVEVVAIEGADVRGFSGLTPGDNYYLGNNGAITGTENAYLVGVALSASRIKIKRTSTVETIAKRILAGEGITVSGNPVPVTVGLTSPAEIVTIADNGDVLNIGFSGVERQAQSFPIVGSTSVVSVKVSIRKVGSPGDNLICAIQGDSGGSPDGVDIDTDSVVGSTLGAFADHTFTLSAALTTGTYWVILRRSGALSGSDLYSVEGNSTAPYADGVSKYFNGSSWDTNVGKDMGMVVSATPDADAIYRSDANDTDRDNFIGFVTGTVAKGSEADVYFVGVLDGFSGLTPGATYYVQDTIGTIGTSAGSTSIKVGKAISATELMVIVPA